MEEVVSEKTHLLGASLQSSQCYDTYEPPTDQDRLTTNGNKRLDSVLANSTAHGYSWSGSVQNAGDESVSTRRGSTRDNTKAQLYYRRYYILAVFSLMSLTQGLIWNTWSPISDSAKRLFNWTDGSIAMLANWGTITYIITMPFFSWLIDAKGLRVSCICCSFFLASGAGVRCITLNPPWANWLINLGQVLNGLGGPVAMAACTVVSSVWFPPNQRTTATSIGAMCNMVGLAVSFIIGPFLVPESRLKCNSTDLYNASVIDVSTGNHSTHGCGNLHDLDIKEREDVLTLLYTEFGFSGVVLLAILLYFPSKPPKPPSLSAVVKRASFKAGIIALVKNGNLWLLATVYGLSLGVMMTWLAVLDVNISPYGVTQDESGWIGFYSTVAGTFGALVVARVADMLAKHMKFYVLGLFVLAGGAFIWIALIFIKVAPYKIEYLYISVIFGGLCLNAAVPLIYELACEITFPVSEAVTCGALTLYFNVAALVFLSVMMVPNIGVTWTNWCVPASILVCIPLLFLVKEKYNRLDMDMEIEPPSPDPQATGPPSIAVTTPPAIMNKEPITNSLTINTQSCVT